MESQQFKPLNKRSKKCFRKLNNLEVENLLEFANRITPKRWNIFIDHRNFINWEGILNIYLDFLQPEYYCDVESEAMVHGGLSYNNRVGFAHIKFWYPAKWYSWRKIQNILIHELTHIAILRLHSCKRKTYLDFCEDENGKKDNTGYLMFFEISISLHGKIFQSMHKKMKLRFKKYYKKRR